MTILNHVVEMKTEMGEDDLEAWKWLQDIVSRLGEHGMSSEESCIENEVEEVLRAKRMTWRRPIERELELVDLQRLMDIDVFLPQGSQPMKRLRGQTIWQAQGVHPRVCQRRCTIESGLPALHNVSVQH